MSERTYFDVLGVARTFALDEAELQKQYLALSKQHHPDRFAKADGHERAQAAMRTTELNDAFRTLKHPASRAEYLLKLHGIDLGDERPQPAESTKRLVMDPQLLMEIMELREALAGATQIGDERKIRTLTEDVLVRQDNAMARVTEGFAKLEAGDTQQLEKIARAAVSLRYFRRFLEEVDAHDEAKDA